MALLRSGPINQTQDLLRRCLSAHLGSGGVVHIELIRFEISLNNLHCSTRLCWALSKHYFFSA